MPDHQFVNRENSLWCFILDYFGQGEPFCMRQLYRAYAWAKKDEFEKLTESHRTLIRQTLACLINKNAVSRKARRDLWFYRAVASPSWRIGFDGETSRYRRTRRYVRPNHLIRELHLAVLLFRLLEAREKRRLFELGPVQEIDYDDDLLIASLFSEAS